MQCSKSLFFLSTFLLGTACGGSGTSGDRLVDFSDRPDLSELALLVDGVPFRGPDTLPQAGEANFEGILSILLENGSGYDGVMQLSVDLGDDRVNGNVSSFQNLDGNNVAGELIIADGDIERDVDIENFFLFVAPLEGTLTDATDTIEVDGVILGDLLFNGDRHLIGGAVRGDYFVNGQRVLLIEGSFVGDCVDELDVCDEELSLAPQPVDQAALDALNSSFDDFRDFGLSLPVSVTDTLPNVGSASFNGVMNINANGTPTLTGEFEVEADLVNSTLSGSAYNFYNEDAFVLEGTLDITEGEIERFAMDVDIVDAKLSGELNDANSTYVIDGSVGGEISNVDPIIFSGRSAGLMTIDGENFSITGGVWAGTNQ